MCIHTYWCIYECNQAVADFFWRGAVDASPLRDSTPCRIYTNFEGGARRKMVEIFQKVPKNTFLALFQKFACGQRK